MFESRKLSRVSRGGSKERLVKVKVGFLSSADIKVGLNVFMLLLDKYGAQEWPTKLVRRLVSTFAKYSLEKC